MSIQTTNPTSKILEKINDDLDEIININKTIISDEAYRLLIEIESLANNILDKK